MTTRPMVNIILTVLTPLILLVNEQQLKFFGSYNTAFIAPSLFQLYDTYSGNADLAPEESQSFELGLTWVKEDGRATLAFFSAQRILKLFMISPPMLMRTLLQT